MRGRGATVRFTEGERQEQRGETGRKEEEEEEEEVRENKERKRKNCCLAAGTMSAVA